MRPYDMITVTSGYGIVGVHASYLCSGCGGWLDDVLGGDNDGGGANCFGFRYCPFCGAELGQPPEDPDVVMVDEERVREMIRAARTAHTAVRADRVPSEVDPSMGFAPKLVRARSWTCGHCGAEFEDDPGVMCIVCGWAFGDVEEVED